MAQSSYKRWTLILIGMLAVLLLCPARLSAWTYANGTLLRQPLSIVTKKPGYWSPTLQADLLGDGNQECLSLNGSSAQISNCSGKVLWHSPVEWTVKEASIGDLNHDGKMEVDLVVWRPFKPWPIDSFLPSGGRIKNFHDRSDQSCHVILMGWARGGYNELWAGSSLIQPVRQVQSTDLNDDGWQEMTALEGFYDQIGQDGYFTVWHWNGFGFELQAQLRQRFQKYLVVDTGKQKVVLLQK